MVYRGRWRFWVRSSGSLRLQRFQSGSTSFTLGEGLMSYDGFHPGSSCLRWGGAACFLILAVSLARGQGEVVVLSDIVGGGDGRGSAPAENVGISADTGVFEITHTNADV